MIIFIDYSAAKLTTEHGHRIIVIHLSFLVPPVPLPLPLPVFPRPIPTPFSYGSTTDPTATATAVLLLLLHTSALPSAHPPTIKPDQIRRRTSLSTAIRTFTITSTASTTCSLHYFISSRFPARFPLYSAQPIHGVARRTFTHLVSSSYPTTQTGYPPQPQRRQPSHYSPSIADRPPSPAPKKQL